MAMPPTRRHNTRPKGNDPAALAARLPEELKGFGLRTDQQECQAQIAAWLSTQVPRQGAELTKPVMDEAGLTYLFSLRDRMMSK